MKQLISVYWDGAIGITSCSPRDLAALTGPSGAYTPEWAAREISIRTDPALGPVWPRPLVEEWANAFVSGGLPEDAAYDLLQRMADATIERDQGKVCHGRQRVDPNAVPSKGSAERNFRDAWECPNGAIKVNMPKARIIQMDRIRTARNAELAKLDVSYMKAVEASDLATQQQIAAQKQALRDIPQTFDLAKYRAPSTLEAAWPAELPR